MTDVHAGAELADEVRVMETAWFASYPYATFERMRSEAPVFHSERDGIYVLTKYEDIREVSRNPRIFANGYHVYSTAMQILVDDALDIGGPLPAPAEARRRSHLGQTGEDSIIFADGERHMFLRKLASYAFTPRAVARLEAEVEAVAASMFDELEAETEVDFIDRVAAPVPIVMIARLLGVPEEDGHLFRRWSDAFCELGDENLAGEGEGFEARVACTGEFNDYFLEALTHRRSHPVDDLLTTLVQAEYKGRPLADDELLMMITILLIAGNETTRGLLSGTGQLLAEHPDQREILRSRPELLPSAVEELLRVVSPVTHMCRTALKDSEIRGVPIPKGSYLCLLYPAANRDEDIWERADQLDVTRPAEPTHVAFGFAEHFCLGASLARREARIVIAGLLERFSGWEVVGPTTRAASHMTPGITKMPVVLHR